MTELPPLPPALLRVRQRLLQQIKQEIQDFQIQMLHKAVWGQFGRSDTPEPSQRIWDVQVKLQHKPRFPLPPDRSVTEVLDRLNSSLLILGQSGSGKTSTLGHLADHLLNRAETTLSAPIPIWLDLTHWTNQRSITDWVTTQLQTNYGLTLPLAQDWLQEKRLFLLFDSIDRLPEKDQDLCLQALNQLLSQGLSLILCARLDLYKRCPTRLYLKGAILLQSLTPHQIEQYLNQIGGIELWQILQQDPGLMELARKPLLLNMMRLSYDELSVRAWTGLRSTTIRQHYLLSAYVRSCLRRDYHDLWYPRGQEPLSDLSKRWLAEMARSMQSQSQSEFQIIHLQPHLLQSHGQRMAYITGIGILEGLGIGLLFSLLSGRSFVLLLGLVIGLLSSWLTQKHQQTIRLNDYQQLLFLSLKPQGWPKLFIVLSTVLVSCLLVLFLILAITNPTSAAAFWQNPKAFASLMVGLALMQGILFANPLIAKGLKFLFVPKTLVQPTGVYTIAHLAKNTIGLILVGCLGAALVFGLTEIPLQQMLILCLYSGLLLGIAGGGEICIQHWVLRWILFSQKQLPWNYDRFLRYASNRLILRHHQGRYQFIHQLLADYFADLP